MKAYGDEWEDELSLWESRRSIARGVLTPIAGLKRYRAERRKDKVPQVVKEEPAAAVSGSEDDMKNAIVTTVLAAALFTALIRIGGRAAVFGLLGFDMLEDAGIKSQLNQFLDTVNNLGSLKLLAFLLAWVVTKTFCLDALGVVLALSSGILFGGVFQGALYSSICATLASLVGFLGARSFLRETIASQIEQRPVFRALDRAVSKDGLKTVFTLRLAPIIPGLPVGAYNILYGVTSVSVLDFLLGVFGGSFKPYFLDSYLGVMGKELVNGQADDSQQGLLILTFVSLTLLGTFASQVASRVWEEAKSEVIAQGELEDGEWDWFVMLGIEKPKEGLWVDEWGRINTALDDEWSRVQANTTAMGGIDEQREDLLVPPYPDGRPHEPPGVKAQLAGIVLFPFALMGKLSKVLSEK